MCDSAYLLDGERKDCDKRVRAMVSDWEILHELIQPVPDKSYLGLTFKAMEEKVRYMRETIRCMGSSYRHDRYVNHSPQPDLMDEMEAIRKSCEGLRLEDYLHVPRCQTKACLRSR